MNEKIYLSNAYFVICKDHEEDKNLSLKHKTTKEDSEGNTYEYYMLELPAERKGEDIHLSFF